MTLEIEAMRNLQCRVRNLNEHSPYAAWKTALEAYIEMMKTSHLEAVSTDQERQERRVAINSAKTTLLELLKDPDAIWREYVERERSNAN